MFLKQLLLGLGLCAALAAADDDHSPTPLTINNAEYEKRCGEGSDPNYPCFTFLGGDLKDVHAEIWTSIRTFPATSILVKNDEMRDFAIDDPNSIFSIYWRAFDVKMIYSPIDTSKAKFRIQIEAPENGPGRIWVNDGLDGEGIDLDSNTSFLGDQYFTSKWLRIHVGNDK